MYCFEFMHGELNSGIDNIYCNHSSHCHIRLGTHPAHNGDVTSPITIFVEKGAIDDKLENAQYKESHLGSDNKIHLLIRSQYAENRILLVIRTYLDKFNRAGNIKDFSGNIQVIAQSHSLVSRQLGESQTLHRIEWTDYLLSAEFNSQFQINTTNSDKTHLLKVSDDGTPTLTIPTAASDFSDSLISYAFRRNSDGAIVEI